MPVAEQSRNRCRRGPRLQSQVRHVREGLASSKSPAVRQDIVESPNEVLAAFFGDDHGRLDLEDAHAVRHRLAHRLEFQQVLTDLTRRAPAGTLTWSY